MAFGTFIGERRRRLEVCGFSLAEIVDRAHEVIPTHTHAAAHFCLIVKGWWVTTARGAGDTCGPPTLIFNPAGTTHRDGFRPDCRGGTFLTLSVAPETVERAGGQRALGIDHATALTEGEIPALGIKLYRELLSSDDLSPVVIEGLALELLGRTTRSRRQSEDPLQPWLRQAHELVNDCFQRKLTVNGVAEAVGVGPLHLSRCFRRVYGRTVGEMVRERRVRHAAELLARSGTTIAEVALDSGFADQAQLTKSFKRVTTMTPGQYRRLFAPGVAGG